MLIQRRRYRQSGQYSRGKSAKRLAALTAAVLIFWAAPLGSLRVYALELVNVKPLFQLKSGGGRAFHLPSDVTVGLDDRIYVLDGVVGRVVVFSKRGKYLFQFGQRGSDKGEFWDALGLDVHPGNGNIYVADSKNHSIQVFSPEGKFLFLFKLIPTEEGKKPADPTDVTIVLPKVSTDIFITITDKRTKCFIVDNNNHRILIYDENGVYIKTYGFMGFEKEQLRFPYAIQIDKDRNFFISEVSNTRVQVLDEDFDYIRDVGTWGVRKGQFYRPQGLALDPKRNSFVSDSYIDVVQAFNFEGDFLGAVGVNNKLKKFASPVGLYIKDKRLYVVEMWGNKVSVFQMKDYP